MRLNTDEQTDVEEQAVSGPRAYDMDGPGWDTVDEVSSPEPDRTVRKGGRRNTELVIITWLFAALFFFMIGYLIWFQIVQRPKVTASVYNTRQDIASDRIIRGSILTEEGEALAYTNVDYTGNEQRYYPYGRIFAHTIGYATNGKSGLEASAGSILMESHSSLIGKLKSAGEDQKQHGDNIIVTLDPGLQQAAYYALGDYKGAVVVLEPDTGKILAMVSKPDFDPNTIGADWEALVSDSQSSVLLNRATSGLYPPGSTFKILTALAYLREHQDTYEQFQYECQGYMTQGDVTITCYNWIVHGTESLKTAFANSCNTAFASIGLELSNSAFRRLAETFLFNRDLPARIPAAGSVFSLREDSSVGEQMTTAIGQGDTLVTPLHMAMITATVANAGTMMRPYMISRVENTEGTVVESYSPEIYDELMTLEEAQALTDFMKETVNSGTGTALSGAGYSVAGKTGSAEYGSAEAGGTHSWFVGFSNVDDPDIVVAVIAEDGGTGSSTAVPIARHIFDQYYYG